MSDTVQVPLTQLELHDLIHALGVVYECPGTHPAIRDLWEKLWAAYEQAKQKQEEE